MPDEWTKERLESVGREWQRELELQDWQVRYDLLPQDKMEDKDSWGSCDWSLDHKQALVRVTEPDTRTGGDGAVVMDTEEIVVHELLHLHLIGIQHPFAYLKDYLGSALYDQALRQSNLVEEQAINTLTRALVRLKRGEQR